MITFDSHTHSGNSYDADKSTKITDMCEAAISKGLTHIAITDHFDVNAIPDGYDMPYDPEKIYAEFCEAKEIYGGRITMSFGVELGQYYQYPALAVENLKKYHYQTILGSIHSLRGKPDFAFQNMHEKDEDEFKRDWLTYLEEACELLDLGGFDVLTHLTYPLRYMNRIGRFFDMSYDYDHLTAVLKKVIDKDVILEVNSSGYRQGVGSPLPDARIIKRYVELGGRLVAIGSDAHRAADIGSDFDRVAELLKQCGIDTICFPYEGNRIFEKI